MNRDRETAEWAYRAAIKRGIIKAGDRFEVVINGTRFVFPD